MQCSSNAPPKGGTTCRAVYFRLAPLTQMEQLYLEKMELSDISVLANYNDLRLLRLWDNEIQDISALAGLTNLDLARTHGQSNH